MKHFTIDSNDNITLHESKKSAKKTGSPVFSTEEQFSDIIGSDSKRLAGIYNSLPGVKPVTRFANRKIAAERIWDAIQGLGRPIDAQPGPDFASCAKAVETAPGPQTPFDEPMTASEQPAATEPAPAHVEERAEPELAEAAEQVASVSAQVPDVAPEAATPTKKTTRTKRAPQSAPEATAPKAPESKTTIILTLLKRPGGASLAEIMAATSWQKHSVRGFISGTLGKKMGLTVHSSKAESGERRYSIA